MYYKIKALSETGVSITLHYFDYKKERHANGINGYCEHVIAYKRKPFWQTPGFSKPHIVASRINHQLIRRLNADDNPILLEGIHCTGIIPYLKNKSRKIIVRLHNDEAVYYRHLAKAETNFFKSAYYKIESVLLKQYQKSLPADATYVTISEKDENVFKTNYGLKKVFFIPAFVPWQAVASLTGSGTYCLYHGNLSVAENEAAALWLIETVFSKLHIPFMIAGKPISEKVIKAAAPFPHITLNANPAAQELETLIAQAHVHVLPDFNNTGVKLKWLHALFCGRFCITHGSEMAQSNTVAFARTPEDYMRFLKSFMNRAFTEVDVAERQQQMLPYNNKTNAQLLNARLW